MTVLTKRQSQLLTLAAAGKTDVQIAGDLGIAHQTARRHRKLMFQRIGARNIAHAVAIGFRQGWLA